MTTQQITGEIEMRFWRWLKSLFKKKPKPQAPKPPVVTEPVGEVDLTPYLIALREKGTKEVSGSKHNPRILEYHKAAGGHSTDEIAWCSSFMNWCHDQAGLPKTGSAAARSWAGFGADVTDQPKEGDIIVFARKGSSWRGHVGFFVKESNAYWYVFGGNQSNQVKLSKYSKFTSSYKLLSIRRYEKGAS